MELTPYLLILLSVTLIKGSSCTNTSSAVFNSSGFTRFINSEPPEYVYYTLSNNRTRGMRDARNADFIVGGLFAVHSNVGGNSCGSLRTQGGIDRVEAMLFALDNINTDPCLLPNFTLGYDIRDTCFVEQIGLDEAADLILTGTQAGVETECEVRRTSNETIAPQTIGLVGAGSSPVSIVIAGLGRLFGFPQISYSSTSAILSNRDRFSYFYRTVPSDNMEARAIVNLIQHYGWTYISTIFSRNSYGQSGIDDVHALAARSEICIDLNEGIKDTFEESDYQTLANKLLQSTANVVVMFATGEHVERLFEVIEKIQSFPHFTWIATSAWAQLATTLPVNHVSGLFGVIPFSNHLALFQDYYSNLTPQTNPRNPWFPEFFNCSSASDCVNQTGPPPLSQMEQEYSIQLVIDAVYAFAHALEEYLYDSCELPIVWNRDTKTCRGQSAPLNGSALLQYIARVNFTSPTGNVIKFNSDGSVQAMYEIMNFQVTTSDNMTNSEFKCIGQWDSTLLNFTTLRINNSVSAQFFDAQGIEINEPGRSECGDCTPGQFLRKVTGSCCGLCDNCLGELFSNSSRASACSNCSAYGEMWGNNSTGGSTGCVEIPKTYVKFSDPFAIIITIGSIAGLILLIPTVVILAVFWTSPVIKASSRESIILVLIGAGCSFASSFIYLSPPSLGICSLQRILIWFCFSLMYGSLLMKVIRIARIFVFQKSSMKRLKCVQTYQQVLFSLLIVVGQMLIVAISLAVVRPNVLRNLRLSVENPNALPDIVVTCQPEPLLGLIISVLYEAGLILVTVVLGTFTFKSPANFNESKAICVSAYILLCIWTFFFVSYIFTESIQQLQNAFIALTNTLGAYAILGSFIGPRIFVVLFWKERNSKEFSRRATDGDTIEHIRDTVSSGGVTIDAPDQQDTAENGRVPTTVYTNCSQTVDNGHTGEVAY